MTENKRDPVRDPTFRDLINALRTINKFVEFGERAGELIRGLYKAGVDLTRLNPYDLTSLIQLARASSETVGFSEEELEELLNDFEDLMDTPISEIENALRILQRYTMIMRRAENQLKTVTKTMGVRKEELEGLASLFGIKLPSMSKSEYYDYEEEEEEESISEEELEELKKVIKKFREER